MTALLKSSLVYRFTCKCDIYYIGRTNQSLEIRINQHIPLSIRTENSDCPTTPNSYNSTPAIGCHLLVNQTSACVRSPTMFTVLETSTNESCHPFWKHYLLKNINRNYVSKSNPIFHCFLITSDHRKKTSLTVPSQLVYSNFFSICFFFTLPGFAFSYNPMLTPSRTKSIVIDNFLKRSDRKKGSPF